MNRRQFLRSGALFGAALAVAPSMALAAPKESDEQAEAPDYPTACPGYAAILQDLIVGFRHVYPDAALDPWSLDLQFLSVIAYQQCGMFCAMDATYRSYDPRTATGRELDSLLGERRPGESDDAFRLRWS